MPLDELTQVIEYSRRGAQRAARNLPDHAELTNVAELIGHSLDSADDQLLIELQRKTREEAPEALPWMLSILRTLTGTLVEQNAIRHLTLIPVLHGPVHQGISIPAIHEIEGSLEYALDLGYGSLKLMPSLVPFSYLQRAKPSMLRALIEQPPDLGKRLEGLTLDEGCSAMIGLWRVERSDRARLARKLVHAMQRTPELVAWQRRTEALLQGCADGAFSVYPILQLQDFFSGVRQILFVHLLEKAYKEIPDAHLVKWHWEGERINCTLRDVSNRERLVQGNFPDEPKEFAQMRLAAFCARRSLFIEPQMA